MSQTQIEKKQKESSFDKFVGQYALSKTLRFELRPVGKTLEHMQANQVLVKDREIEGAYQILKPVFDKIHEDFITQSLDSEKARTIEFSSYFAIYRNKDTSDYRALEAEEKNLRAVFDTLYAESARVFAERAGKNKNGKMILREKGFRVLTESGILQYIKKYTDTFADIASKEKIDWALEKFEGFFTYFTGFNQNRENYYTTKEEKATAVASRVVNENLPKFCDNIILFENKKSEYLGAYKFLQARGRVLEMQDGETGKMVPLYSIQGNVFDIAHFGKCLSQAQIEAYNAEIANANYIINLYNQANKDEKGKKLMPFKTLYKQIGCGKRNALFFALTHEKRSEAEAVRRGDAHKKAFSVEEILQLSMLTGEKLFQERVKEEGDETIQTVPDLLGYLESKKRSSDFSGVYWSKTAMNTISNRYFASWHSLLDQLKNEKTVVSFDKKREEQIKIKDTVELSKFFAVLNTTENWNIEGVLFKESLTKELPESPDNAEENERRSRRREIISQSQSPSDALLKMIFEDIREKMAIFLREKDAVFTSMNAYFTLSEKDTQKEEKRRIWKEKIKMWLDEALTVNQMVKYFLVKESKVNGSPIDSVLSEGLKKIIFESKVESLEFSEGEDVDWFGWYDAVRNFITKKPQDDVKENKLKLNFEKSTLAGGWDINKESNNLCVILKNPEKKTFLAIMAKSEDQRWNKIFEKKRGNALYSVDGNSIWEKMEYKLLPGPNKMLPKCLLPKKNRKKYGATDEILNIYERGSFKKSDKTFSEFDLHRLIDFYKNALQKYEDWKCFNFSFRETEQYKDISQFYAEVEKQGYKLSFSKINGDIVNELVTQGKIYLFEIRNQDSNDGKREGHRNNLHTQYWKTVFENVSNCPKLNGEAEIFHREPIDREKLKQIKDKEGNLLKNKKNETVVEGYRFSKEKFMFHVPITLNFCLKNSRINEKIKKEVKEGKKFSFLGIDRGEKHLAYYSLVDQEGKMIDQGSFNVMNGKDYNAILDERAKNRNTARKNWQAIGNIKNLKDGYISQVVKRIADLAVKHQAFIVLEDLNVGFMRGRQKIEKQVYQKLELALAKKLNFLVDKSAPIGEVGSVTSALQLTPPVNTFGDMERAKQFGIMLYTRANYTSQTDPVTGWRKIIYLKKGSREYMKEQIIGDAKKGVKGVFSEIIFDGKDYVFIYTDIVGKEWKMYSGKEGKSLDRFRGKRGKDKDEWMVEPQDIPENLNRVFEGYDKKRSLLNQMLERNAQGTDDRFDWDSLRYTIDILQQIRNTGEKSDERDADFLLSPVRNENGEHFDSRLFWDKDPSGETAKMPVSGDANGAYNIARKGIIMVEHIRHDYKTYIRDEEWSAWLAGKDTWENWMRENEKDLKWKEKKN